MGRIVKAFEVEAMALSHLDTPEAKAAAELLVTAQRGAFQIGEKAKSNVVDIAIAVAREMLLREIDIDPASLEAIYARALESSRGLTGAVVRVHPEDRARHPIDEMAKRSGFTCVDDDSVGRSGCRIVAGNQEVDATLDTLLGCFEKAMKATDNGSI